MLTDLALDVMNVVFVFEVDEPQNLPRYLFSSVRGAWGAALKRISCVSRGRKTCLECPFHWDCAYGYLFETPRPQDSERMKLYPYVPHPFAVAPPYPPPYESPLEIEFTLVGRGIDFFPHVVLAMESTGKKGLGPKRVPMRLASIREEGRELLRKGEILLPLVKSNYEVREAKEVEATFVTPTKLKFCEREVVPHSLEFHIFLRNLLRRVSSLCYFHGGKELEADFKGFIEAAKRIEIGERKLEWVSFRRRSSRTGQAFRLSGFTGKVVFHGDITPFTPFMELGSLVHVGKSTGFGLGKYEWRILA